MGRVTLSSQLSAFITARIGSFPMEAPDQLQWEAHYVAEFEALPLYLGWTETIGLRADGEVIRWSTEGEYPGVRPVEEAKWVISALVDGARRYPELHVLLPVREAGAVHCGCRNHPLFMSGKILCGECGGLGWLPGGDIACPAFAAPLQ